MSFRGKSTPKFSPLPEEGDDREVGANSATLTRSSAAATRDEAHEGIRRKNETKKKAQMRLLPSRSDSEEGIKELASALPNNTGNQSRSC